ncbi:PucR family transcriptional regulator [Gordonibacter urolithinfaciens]|uniref:PucR family transcriptional regulator n=1 Tax=Gordonibacter urolithinfaciens TaxID=1335613 RepID=UPI001D098E29|nr:helix-turn-helix domain-containing protein [Gordonibacter urolithinfaciens]MBS6976592.1 helix-turn-helix domain-containing protein [Eggerthellaceae bacterium]MCB6562096.1 helix-turn-helix domain-containing protein [Gordonibacter urolithinfaciens]MCB7086392.1 helix-turn-helix domain-containing protein [Gordonibacter urolithinfaciens]
MSDESHAANEAVGSLGSGAGASMRFGDVSYAMLIDALGPVELLHVPPRQALRFSWYASVPNTGGVPKGEGRRNALFLCHDEVAENLLANHPGCFCVVLVDGSQPPEWIAASSLRNRVVAIKQDKRFYFYDSLLQSLFVNDLVWENEMDRVVYNHGRIDRLISLSEETMKNFVCVTDTGYNLISHSRGIEPPGEGFQHLVDNNCYDQSEVAEIEEKVLAEAGEKTRLVICEPNERHPYPTLHYPIFIDNAYLFHVVLACTEGSLACLQDLFLKFVKRVVAIANEFWNTTVNLESPWHRVLIGLIDGEPMTEDYLEAQLSKTAVPSSRQFRLLYLPFSSRKPFSERSLVIEASKNLNQGLVYPFMYQGSLLVLEYTASSDDAALSGNGVRRDIEEHLHRPFDMVAGASQVFFDIEDLEQAYRQATTAYAMRGPLKNEHAALNGSADIPCFPFEHVLKYYILTEGHDTDLVEFSFGHSILKRLAEEDKAAGTDLVRMIWVYLNNGRNATETSKLVHVHRNTVLYHIGRLEKRFDISFDSPLLRSRMMLDYHRLLLEGDI